MSFFEKFKNKLKNIFNALYSSMNRIFFKESNSFNFEFVKIYNHKDFSYIFIDTDKINLLSEHEFKTLLSYIINSIEKHLIRQENVLINIITKIIFQDQLNITYLHSLTYKSLFKVKDLSVWQSVLINDIRELLNNYNDSQIKKIELRLDYLRASDFK